MSRGFLRVPRCLVRRAASGISLLAVALTVLTLPPHSRAAAPEMLDGLEVGLTAAGHPYKGASDAPLTLIEYSDYLCPFCGRYFRSTLPTLIDEHVRAGELRVEFRHFPIAQLHPTAIHGHVAAACAAEQGAAIFWRFHDALFERQDRWSALADPAPFLDALATELGVDAERHRRCREAPETREAVEHAVEEAQALGLSGTPSFRVGESEGSSRHTLVGARPAAYFTEVIDALLAGREPPKPPEPPRPELPAWAKTEALAADPARAGFTRSGDPFLGDPQALFVVVEYTDFQCPACARHALEERPTILERLVDTGRVRWVVKHLPLREHDNAAAAAVAAVCAGDQGRYWEMYERLFERQDDWAGSDPPDPELLRLAGSIPVLDGDAFERCLGSREALERVLPGMHDAATVTRSTPTFVVLDGESGRTVRGARDADAFVDAVEAHLPAADAAVRDETAGAVKETTDVHRR